MNQMENAKKRYESIPIPDELSERVMQEIRRADMRRKTERKPVINRRGWRRIARGVSAAAASLAVVFMVMLNTNTVFAETVSTIPVIGTVARVLTFRSYEKETTDMKIAVDIPSIEMVNEDFSGLEKSVNEEIHALCEEYAREAEERAMEYRQAFLDTGGTEEQWAAHNIEIKVWYEVKSQTDQYLSLAVMGAENWTSAYSETRYYNFDLKEGKIITLKDVLGENYAQIADESIRNQMQERTAEGAMFWPEEFKGVTEDTSFYMNESGNPVVFFEKYEIAPGSEGTPEFEIVSGEN